MHNSEGTLLNPLLSNKEIDHLDDVVTTMLSCVRKKVEGMQRNIPHSHEKAQR